MQSEQKTPFYHRNWFVSIGVFFIVQLLFLFMEKTGWILNLRDFDGTLFGRVTELHFFNEWFQFYETPWFNILTLFFALVAIIQMALSVMKSVLLKVKG